MLLMPAAEPASKHKKVNLRSASCTLRLTFFCYWVTTPKLLHRTLIHGKAELI